MSGRSRRRDVRDWQESEARAAELRRPRHYRDEPHLMGIGTLKTRVAVLPSFEPTEVWDIRMAPDTNRLRLYVARSAEPGQYEVVGYGAVDMPHKALVSIDASLRKSTLLMGVPQELAFGMADGVRLEVSFHTFGAHMQFHWAETLPPEGWGALEKHTLQALQLFRANIATKKQD